MEYKRIISDGLNLLGGKVGASVISIVNIMVLTRLLTTEEMGVYSLFMMMVNLALVLGLTWSDGSLVRFGREEYLETDKQSINDAFWIKLLLFLAGSVIFSVIFLVFSEDISAYIGIYRWQVVLIISAFLLNGLMSFLGALFRSVDHMKKAAYVLTLQKLLYLIGLSSLYLFEFSNNTLIFVLLNVSFLLAIIYNLKNLNVKIISKYHFNKDKFCKMWTFSWPILIGASGLYIINYVDLFVIKLYMSNKEVGIYSVAYSGFMSICGVIILMQMLFMPLIVEYKHKGQFELIARYINNIYLFILAWAVIAAVGISISSTLIPILFTDNYIAAVHPFDILLVSSIFYFSTVCLMPIVSAFDLMLYYQAINLIRSLVNVGGDFYLVPEMGIDGAAYATLLSFITGSILSAILIMRNRNKVYGRA